MPRSSSRSRNARPHTGEQPASARLDAPEPKAPVEAVAADGDAAPMSPSADGVQMLLNSTVRIVDQDTGVEPVVDGLFERLTSHGTAWRCTRRLLEIDATGISRLLLCAGAVVSAEEARSVTDRLGHSPEPAVEPAAESAVEPAPELSVEDGNDEQAEEQAEAADENEDVA